ncbi:MAG: hypothetical protein ACFFDU_06270 [Candidatus Thorarchaeota archaeon]
MLHLYTHRIYDWTYYPLNTLWLSPTTIRVTWLQLRCHEGGFILELWRHNLLLYSAQTDCWMMPYEMGPILYQTNWIQFYLTLTPALLAAIISGLTLKIIDYTLNRTSP